MITLEFSSMLNASQAEIWQWISSAEGIRTEMPCWYRMRLPAGITTIANAPINQSVGRCSLWFFGLPYGVSQLTFTELAPGEGFVEQSPMTGMRQWQHRRWLSQQGNSVRLTDTLTFRPRAAKLMNKAIVQRFFTYRHAVLRSRFGQRVS